MQRKLAAGNWKMHGLGADLDEVRAIARAVPDTIDTLICPPATLLDRAVQATLGSPLMLGGQDCHPEAEGAFTGDVSARMLADAGATHVIVGHSERRTLHGETNDHVRAKAAAALSAGLIAVVCLGETLEERRAGRTLDVVRGQLDGSMPETCTADTLVVAYEPVWAIGTGEVPSTGQIAEVHGALRARLADLLGPDQAQRVRLLYGGSVKPGNAADIFAIANVDGALVGGASLTAADFIPIAKALAAA